MVATMTDRPVAMRVAVIPREDALEQLVEVGLGSTPRLEQRDTGSGVRHEDMDQPVPADPPGEAHDLFGEVMHPTTTGLELEGLGVHVMPSVTPDPERGTTLA